MTKNTNWPWPLCRENECCDTDCTSQENQSLREQLAAALAAFKVKDEAMQGALYSGSPYTTAFENALAIKPGDMAALREVIAQVLEESFDADGAHRIYAKALR